MKTTSSRCSRFTRVPSTGLCSTSTSRYSSGRMTSRDSSTRRSSDDGEPLVADIPHQRVLRPDSPVRSLEEFVEFLAAVEAVGGSDDRPRKPMIGDRFLL